MTATPPPPPGPGYGYGYQAGPARPTQEERTWALAGHIGCLVGAWIAMAFLVPLLILLVKGSTSPFVRQHAVESLNFQLSMLLYLVIGVVVTVLTLGLGLVVVVPVAVVLGLLWLLFVVLATVRASNGESYRYPLTIRVVK